MQVQPQAQERRRGVRPAGQVLLVVTSAATGFLIGSLLGRLSLAFGIGHDKDTSAEALLPLVVTIVGTRARFDDESLLDEEPSTLCEAIAARTQTGQPLTVDGSQGSHGYVTELVNCLRDRGQEFTLIRG